MSSSADAAIQQTLDLSQDDFDFVTKKPIQFDAGNFADYIWGGWELYKLKGMPYNQSHNIAAESWELSGHSKYPSICTLPSGKKMSLPDLLKDKAVADSMLGEPVVRHFSQDFPILAKFFDVQKHMSVQVHPSDKIAKMLGEKDPGKGEVFVILEVYDGAEGAVYLGLKEGVDHKQFKEALHHQENILELMHKILVKPGLVYVVPSGILHCWTGGTLAVEITEPSDLTYRLYDFGRGRPMHIKKGLASIDFDKQYGPELEQRVTWQWQAGEQEGIDFVPTDNALLVQRLTTTPGGIPIKIQSTKSFDALMGIDGAMEIVSFENRWKAILKRGHSLLIPAQAGSFEVRPLGDAKTNHALRITMKCP